VASAVPPFPSDSLARWHDFFASHPHLRVSFTELAQVPLVVDASAVLAELRWIVRRRRSAPVRSALEELVAAGTVVAYAPPWLEDEVNEKLPVISKRERLSLESLRAAWAQYRSAIRFYEPSGKGARGAADPKDVPYSELAHELGGIAVYTRDHHLRAMGAHVIGVDQLRLLRDFARAASPGLTLKVGGALLLLMIAGPTVALAKFGVRLLARLPTALKVSLALAAAWVVLDPRGRAFIRRAAASPKLKPMKELFARYFEELGESQVTVMNRWNAVKPSLPTRHRQPLIAHARAVCVASSAPVSERGIEAAVKKAGYRTGARDFPRYLRRRLRADARFVETQRGYWTVIRVPAVL